MPVSKIQLQNALHKPYNRVLFAKEVLSPVFGTGFSLGAALIPAPVAPNKSESVAIDQVWIYGSMLLDDGTEITCYEVLLKPSVRIEHSKVAIQQYIRKLLISGQAALINFVAPANRNVWRLTLVAKDSMLTDKGVKEKTTNAKRYTFLLGPSEACKTAAERFEVLSTEKEITIQTLENAFSVEKLSKAFFDEYTLHYQNFCNFLQESNYRKSVFNITFAADATKQEKDKASKPIRDFVKKLLGRIVFLYFVQKKGWLGAGDTNYTDGEGDFIRQLFHKSGGNDTFYSNWLTVLFFDTLNKERANDDFIMPDGNMVKVPFLNGGLFDKEEFDEHLLTFPSTLFHHPDFEDDILTAKSIGHARGFLDFLDAFNFTVYEDSPEDHTVAVDPEMLGHIFENLLEDNKDKGAFYTPKEIVHYMCQESLTEYLCTTLQIKDEVAEREAVNQLLKNKVVDDILKPEIDALDHALDQVKICDPAIGSGAFPMGLLQEIFSIKELMAYETGKEWKPAETKLNIIQNAIYGVDIEKGAVDIARLRFWLSLVVDEEKPKALPNLDYKIVVGDSLISKFDGEIVEIDWERKRSVGKADEYVKNVQRLLVEVATQQKNYFNPHNKNKKQLQAEIRRLKIELLINQLSFNKELYISKTVQKGGFMPTAADTRHNTERELQIAGFNKQIAKLNGLLQHPDQAFKHFDWKLDFPEVLNPYLVGENGGFDIVIGNPPYVEAKKLKHISQFLKNYRVYSGTADLSSYFFELGINLCKAKGLLCLINTNKFFNTGYGKPVRELIIENEIKQLINFEQVEVFEGILVSSVIIGIKRIFSNQNNVFPYKKFFKLKNTEFVKTFIEEIENREPYQQKHLTEKEWSFADDSNLVLKSKIEKGTFLLKNIKGVNVYRGVTTGYNPAFIINEEQRKQLINQDCLNETIIKPLLQGRNIRKWFYNFNYEYLIFTKQGIEIDKFQSIKKYLKQYYDDLKPKNNGEDVGRKPGSYNWYEIQDNTAYYPEFEKPKIIWGLTADKWAYAYDDKGHYLPSNGYILTSEIIPVKYLLSIINSNLLKYYFRFIGVMTAGGAFTLKHSTILKLPIKLSTNQSSFIQITDYILFLKSQNLNNPTYHLISTYFEQIIDGMVYELYFTELLQKHACEIMKHLGELPEFTDEMSDEQKMKICKKVFDRLHDAAHPVRVNLEKMKEEIQEIRIIEGIEN